METQRHGTTTPPSGRLERVAASLIALVAWLALAIQFSAVLGRVGSSLSVLWSMSAYFTVLTNLLVAVLFTGVALGLASFRLPRLAAGTTLAIVLVGIVYHLLLRGLLELSGGDVIADFLLHTVTPIIVPAYWLAFVRKGDLTFRDPLLWALYPLAYFGYAMLRGSATGRYAYPFFDAGALGWPRSLANSVAILLGFLVAGYLVVLLDRRLRRAPIGSGVASD